MATGISLGVYLEPRRITLAGLSHGLSGIRLEVVEDLVLPTGTEDRLTAIRSLLSRFLFASEFHCESLTLSLCREGLLLRRLQLPLIAANNLEQVVGFEIEKHFPLNSADLQTGYQAEEDATAKQLRLLLAAMPGKDYIHATTLFQEMGLSPSGVEFSGASLARLDDPDQKLHYRVFISEGAYEFSISRNQRLEHSSWHFCRAEEPAAKWEEILAVAEDAAAAEQLPAPERIEIFGVPDQTLLKNMPAKIFVRGEWPLQLKKSLAVKTRDFSECGVAVGAALAPLVENGFEPINFLPHLLRQKKSRLELWLALTLALLLLVVSGITMAGYNNKYKNIAQSRAKQHKNLIPDLDKVAEAKREIAELEKKLDGFKRLENSRILHLELMKIVTEALPPGEGYVEIVNYTVNGQIYIRGFAKKPLVFVDKLKESNFFTGLDCTTDPPRKDLTGFNVNAKFKRD